MPAPVVAGIDLGGTRIKAALVDRDGTQVATTLTPTPGDLDRPGALVDALAATFDRLRAEAPEAEVVACGAVVPGIVDDARGVAVYASNLRWRDVPVAKPLAERLGVPVALGHDVRAGLRAEVEWGAARGSRNVLFLPLGTGIAGALMLDGHLVVADGWSGEVGHVIVEPGGPQCPCGARGCLETLASAAAVARGYAAHVPAGAPPVDAKGVAALVAEGEPAAVAVWDRAVDALSRAVAMLVSATGVDHVLVGGGLSQSGELLLEPLRAQVKATLTFQRMPRIERATLGDRAGSLGSACLAWDLV
ncbi:ROK family protein [Knoellia koreensis]|uniref:ROK family protein n=1 Tax=Knoellia koreensis TaxID=2730921 RepID=UPI0014896CA1